MKKHVYNVKTGVSKIVDLTEAERIADLSGFSSLEEKATARKLEKIKEIRLQKLIKTDYLANSDVIMTDAIKTWRQALRDIPQNNTTDAEYDLILAEDGDGKLTNEIWSKP
jgi:hypothetical protein